MSTIEQIQMIEELAVKIWEKFKPYDVQQRLLSTWDGLADELEIERSFKPLYPLDGKDDIISCGILGSGGFSTGREELVKAKALKLRLGWAPVEYTTVITNRNRSNGLVVADEFELPGLVLDYTEWRKENEITGSTKLFGFDPGEEPEQDVMEERIGIKKAFDLALHDTILEKLGELPRSISLRGYDFILTDKLFPTVTEVDNTHPANLIVREENGEPAYAGWQESAYNKMREDGFTSFTTTLIRVGYIGSYNDLIKVDAGEMLAISPGFPDRYDKIEDQYLLTLKATGLLPYFWGISNDIFDVEYSTKRGKPVKISQRLVVVGDSIMSGKGVFGQKREDLLIFKRILD